MSLIRFNAWALPDRVGRSMAEHRQIVKLLRTRDSARMAALIRRHLRPAKETYLLHATPKVARAPGKPKRARAAAAR